MKNIQKRIWQLLTMVLALAVLCVPVSGFAESKEKLYTLTVNDIMFDMDQGALKQAIDLTGLDVNMKFGTNDTGDRMLLGLGAAVNGDPAAEASLAMESDEVLIAINGLNKLLTISAEEIQAMVNMASDGEAFNSASKNFIEAFTALSSEATEKELNESFEKLLSEGVDGITVEGAETVEIMGESVEAKKVVYDMNTEQFIAFIEKTFGILEENEAWKAYWSAYTEMIQSTMPEGEDIQLDTQMLVDMMKKVYTNVELKGTGWIVDADTSKAELTMNATLDSNASMGDTQIAFEIYEEAEQATDAEMVLDDESKIEIPSEPSPITLKMNIQSEVNGDLANIDMQMDMQDEKQSGINMAFVINSEEQDSTEQITFNMSMDLLDAGKKILVLQMNGKSTNGEKANSFEAEMQAQGDDKEEFGIKLAYDGTKDSVDGQTAYDGTVSLQMNMVDPSDSQNSGTMNLSFKTHLTEADMPEGALIDAEGKERVSILSMAEEDQAMLSYEIQSILAGSMEKFAQLPAFQALIAGSMPAQTDSAVEEAVEEVPVEETTEEGAPAA